MHPEQAWELLISSSTQGRLTIDRLLHWQCLKLSSSILFPACAPAFSRTMLHALGSHMRSVLVRNHGLLERAHDRKEGRNAMHITREAGEIEKLTHLFVP